MGGNPAPTYNYLAPDNSPIEQKDNLRDLGVRLSSNLSFSLQVEKAANSASQMVGWGLRTFRGRSSFLLLTLFKSLVQPHLDYCSQLWSPSSQELINSQERRQERYMIIFIWKICHELVSGYTLPFTSTSSRTSTSAST